MPKWRWLVAGTFTTSPSGRKVSVSGERFATVMKSLGVDAAVTLPTTLGESVSGPVPVQFTRPRMFRVDDVVDAIEPLQKLAALAKALTKESDLAPEVVKARVERIVGPGGLAERFGVVAPAPEPDPEPEPEPDPEPQPATPTPAPAPTSGNVDDIFSKVELPGAEPEVTAKSGLDAFVSAMRGPKGRPKVVDTHARVDAVKQIRTTVASAAISILGQPTVARLEASWRGLKMLVAASPGHEHLGIDLVDVDPDSLLESLERAVRADDPLRPNAIFVGLVPPPSLLEQLAEFAESRRVPIVVGVSKTLTGPAWRTEDPHVAPDWTALRARTAADWICAAANPVVLANEDTAAGPRVVHGSAAWGVAAILASALGRAGGLHSSIGPSGAVVAPAAHDVDIGFSEPRTIPTREYADVDALKRAAEHGVVLLGSAPGSDQFLASSDTMAGRGGLLERIQVAAERG
ncbi:MAG: type VI secretion system contractile sheath large subunit [Myxococcota bacterium]